MARRADRLNHLQKLARVERRLRSIAKHVVVTRMLALDAHAMGSEPDEWIEPENRNRNLRDELSECVETLHVGHLVNENESTSLFRPLNRIGWKKNCGIHDAPRHGDSKLVASQESERPRNAETISETLRE